MNRRWTNKQSGNLQMPGNEGQTTWYSRTEMAQLWYDKARSRATTIRIYVIGRLCLEWTFGLERRSMCVIVPSTHRGAIRRLYDMGHDIGYPLVFLRPIQFAKVCTCP